MQWQKAEGSNASSYCNIDLLNAIVCQNNIKC